MTIIPNNPASDKASSASKNRNAELNSFLFRKAAAVAIKKRRLRRAEHAINIASIVSIVILFIPQGNCKQLAEKANAINPSQ
jgi:hypothetical protein